MEFINYDCATPGLKQEAFDLYLSSFPGHERRSESCHNTAMTDADFVAEIAVKDDTLLALFFYWRNRDMIYIEHIAVNPALRGQNIGSSVLSQFTQQNPNSTIILEIDPPIDDVAISRLRFYSHLGFVQNPYAYTHPSYAIGGYVHELVIMSHGKILTQKEFDDFVSYMRNRVLKYID